MLQHSARPSANRFKSSLSPIAVLLFLLFCLADGFRPLVPPHTVSTRSPGRVLTFHRSAVAGSVGPTPAPQPRRRILPRLPRLPPAATLAIPLVAALVGYVTNYVGVKMLFYPTAYVGIPLLAQPEGSPLGLLGWQGIVPCKRAFMASRIFDVTVSKLISVSETFSLLSPSKLASLMAPTVTPALPAWVRWGVPRFLVRALLMRSASDLINNAEQLIDVRGIVVSQLTANPATLGAFFQNVAHAELKFLIDSGFGFGFLLGLLQMVQWMLYPKDWTLVVGGCLVGLATNAIALKWIFEPLNPTRVGPFVLQGMFLKRQAEVSRDFCAYISDHVLTSLNVWKSITSGGSAAAAGGTTLGAVVGRNVPLLSASAVTKVVDACREQIGSQHQHAVHVYSDLALGLKATLTERMNRLSPAEFEQVLHPVFQQDEITLIIAGGVLGALAGWLQVLFNKYWERWQQERQRQRRLKNGGLASS